MKQILLIVTIVCLCALTSQAQTTAFNFQGRLNDGSNPANGRYDLQFKLFNAITGGNQVGTTLDRPNLLLINGVFSTSLDFGSAAFSGGDRFIEISLRPSIPANVAPNAFVILGARQQIMSVPYSVKSLNATNADNAANAIFADTATNAANATNATTAQTAVNSQQLGSLPASRYLSTDTNGDVTINGKVTFNGNVYQPATAAGLPKAFVRLNRIGNVINCFNGVTGQSANNCGFTTIHSQTGVFGINFGFDVSSRVIIVTSEWDQSDTVASIFSRSLPNQITIDVRYVNNSNFTDAPINIVIY